MLKKKNALVPKAEGVSAVKGEKGLDSQTATVQPNRKGQESADQQRQYARPSSVDHGLKFSWID